MLFAVAWSPDQRHIISDTVNPLVRDQTGASTRRRRLVSRPAIHQYFFINYIYEITVPYSLATILHYYHLPGHTPGKNQGGFKKYTAQRLKRKLAAADPLLLEAFKVNKYDRE